MWIPDREHFKIPRGTPVSTMLGNIACAGIDQQRQGLWLGYDQLVGLAQPGALNVILSSPTETHGRKREHAS